jgi:tetratricopeptide (TPR) repeat protein
MRSSSGNWFSKLFNKASPQPPGQDPLAIPKTIPQQDIKPGAYYKKGDLIGQKYEVYGILGKGGFGVVYLVYSREYHTVYALKTFRDEFFLEKETRQRFRKEAQTWMNLERHPYLVRAYFVDEIEGRLYITLEYIAPNEQGLNTLENFLLRQPPDLIQSLRWAIQFCHGMEFAYSKGLRAHRDIKPANILIGQNKVIKITDFGLSGVLENQVQSEIHLSIRPEGIGLSCQTLDGVSFGTPTHMPPEQFINASSCDDISDLYSFGIVLYQMASNGKLPFLAPLPRDNTEESLAQFWKAMNLLHNQSPVPRLTSPLFPIIQRCLEKKGGMRYPSFKDLREDLEQMLKCETGEVIYPPEIKDFEGWEWVYKGLSLSTLGREEEAIQCYDKAINIDKNYAHAWNNKAVSLGHLGRSEEALHCCDQALELVPQYFDAWCNKGTSLFNTGHYEEALQAFNQATEINPQDPTGWNGKGLCLVDLDRAKEAIPFFDMALKIDPKFASSWANKGNALNKLGQPAAALICYDQVITINTWDADIWLNKGITLNTIGRLEEALSSFNKSIELNPKKYAPWFGKAIVEEKLGQRKNALISYQRLLTLESMQDKKIIELARSHIRELGG